MQATLPVRTFNGAWLAVMALALAATVFIAVALVLAAPRGATPAVDAPRSQAYEQSITNHSIDERANSVAAPAPIQVDPNADDKVGTSNQSVGGSSLNVDPDSVNSPGARNRIVNVPQ